MEIAIIVILALGIIGLICGVPRWFQENKDINITPGCLMDVAGELALVFSTCFRDDEPLKWIFLVVGLTIVLGLVVYNIRTYGVKDGALASLAELVFAAAAVIVILLVLTSASNKKKKKKSK